MAPLLLGLRGSQLAGERHAQLVEPFALGGRVSLVVRAQPRGERRDSPRRRPPQPRGTPRQPARGAALASSSRRSRCRSAAASSRGRGLAASAGPRAPRGWRRLPPRAAARCGGRARVVRGGLLLEPPRGAAATRACPRRPPLSSPGKRGALLAFVALLFGLFLLPRERGGHTRRVRSGLLLSPPRKRALCSRLRRCSSASSSCRAAQPPPPRPRRLLLSPPGGALSSASSSRRRAGARCSSASSSRRRAARAALRPLPPAAAAARARVRGDLRLPPPRAPRSVRVRAAAALRRVRSAGGQCSGARRPRASALGTVRRRALSHRASARRSPGRPPPASDAAASTWAPRGARRCGRRLGRPAALLHRMLRLRAHGLRLCRRARTAAGLGLRERLGVDGRGGLVDERGRARRPRTARWRRFGGVDPATPRGLGASEHAMTRSG